MTAVALLLAGCAGTAEPPDDVTAACVTFLELSQIPVLAASRQNNLDKIDLFERLGEELPSMRTEIDLRIEGIEHYLSVVEPHYDENGQMFHISEEATQQIYEQNQEFTDERPDIQSASNRLRRFERDNC